MLAVLLGCSLRRSEVAALKLAHLQSRDGRWCIVDLGGKHARAASSTFRCDKRPTIASGKSYNDLVALKGAGSVVPIPPADRHMTIVKEKTPTAFKVEQNLQTMNGS